MIVCETSSAALFMLRDVFLPGVGPSMIAPESAHDGAIIMPPGSERQFLSRLLGY